MQYTFSVKYLGESTRPRVD